MTDLTQQFEEQVTWWTTLGEILTVQELEEALERVRASDVGISVEGERPCVCSTLQRLGLVEAEQGRLYRR